VTRPALALSCALAACSAAEPAPIDADAASDADAETSVVDGGGDALDAADVPTDSSGDSAADAPADVGRPLDEWETLFQETFVPSTTLTEPASASYHCLATASALRRARAGASFTPAFVAKLEAATKASAAALAASASTWGGDGWGLDKAWDAFGDGTTNPATTVYAFQTGLAIWCLAEAGDVLADASMKALAKKAMDAYRTTAFVAYGKGYPIDCTSCGYFWYSRSKSDVGRYVKNTNVEMAVAALVVDRRQGDPANRAVGAEAAASHYGEIVSYANYGYLGRYDASYVAGASLFDDHNSFEVYLLFRAGQLLGNASFQAAAKAHYDAYAPKGSTAYVAYAAAKACRDYVTTSGATNPAGVGLVMDD
jgi:hypothetical protein